MIYRAGLERSQLYPVCEMEEVTGGNQCQGDTRGQHGGGLCPGRLDGPGEWETCAQCCCLRATCGQGLVDGQVVAGL